MKFVVPLYVCKILLLQTFCVLVQQITPLPIDIEYPCDGTKNIIIGFGYGGLPSEKINNFYVDVNMVFTANSVLIFLFDSKVNITFIDEEDKQAIVTLHDVNTLEKRLMKPQEYFKFIVDVTNSEHPNLISFMIDNIEYCHNPVKGLFKKYIMKEPSTNQSKVERRKNVKPDFQCGRRKINHNSVTDPISGIDLPQDTGSVVDGIANPGDWPWHVALYIIPFFMYSKSQKSTFGSTYICGGTLVSRNIVLTVGYCTIVVEKFNERVDHIFYVALGRHNLYNDHDDRAVIVNVEKIITPLMDFNNPAYLRDIALLKLQWEVQFTDVIRPACLWHRRKADLTSESEVGVLAGWGLSDNNSYSQLLQQVNLPMVSQEICIKSNPNIYQEYLSEKHFCAGYHNNGTAPCNGDSGGAFQVFISDNTTNDSGTMSGAWYVRGVMIMPVVIKGYCDENSYVVFADEEKYDDWIESYLGD